MSTTTATIEDARAVALWAIGEHAIALTDYLDDPGLHGGLMLDAGLVVGWMERRTAGSVKELPEGLRRSLERVARYHCDLHLMFIGWIDEDVAADELDPGGKDDTRPVLREQLEQAERVLAALGEATR